MILRWVLYNKQNFFYNLHIIIFADGWNSFILWLNINDNQPSNEIVDQIIRRGYSI